MKKFISIILTIIIVFSLSATYVSAYDANPQNYQTDVSYRVPDSYYLIIPESVEVYNPITISAGNINIDPAHEITVRIGGFSDTDKVPLYSEDGQTTIYARFYDDNSSFFDNSSHTVVGTFGNDDIDTSYTIYGSPTDWNENTPAGVYTGCIWFESTCE
jgi:hypothetical protein